MPLLTKEPNSATPVQPPMPIERRTVYVRMAIRWNENGEVKTARQYSEARPPVAAAKRAVAIGAADPIDSLRAKQTIAAMGFVYGPADPGSCIDLDGPPPPISELGLIPLTAHVPRPAKLPSMAEHGRSVRFWGS
jgi:hypothetical protein